MKERKRINLTVRPALYDLLKRLARRYGFKNTCALSVCVLRLIAQQLAVREDTTEEEETDEELISNAFSQLSDWERTKHNYGEGRGI